MEHVHVISARRFKVLIIMTIATALCYLMFSFWSGWEGFSEAMSKVGFYGVFITLYFALCNCIVRFLRWQKYLHVLGYSLPFFKSMKLYFSGFALSITPGKAGESIRCLFYKEHGIKYCSSFGAFLSERFADGFASLILISGGIYLYPEIRPVFWFVLVGMTLFLFLIYRRRFLVYSRLFIRKLKGRVASLALLAFNSIRDFRFCFQLSTMVYGIILGLIAWILEAAAFYILLDILGYNIGFFQTVALYNLALFIGALTFMPGGLGSTELVLIELLRHNHIPLADAAAAVIVIRLATVWFAVAVGLLALPKKSLMIK